MSRQDGMAVGVGEMFHSPFRDPIAIRSSGMEVTARTAELLSASAESSMVGVASSHGLLACRKEHVPT
jgi:hypothetical protein